MCPPTPCSYGLLVVNVCGNVTRDDARARHSRGGKINEDEKDGVVLAIRGERAFDPVQGSGVVWWKDESSRRYPCAERFVIGAITIQLSLLFLET